MANLIIQFRYFIHFFLLRNSKKVSQIKKIIQNKHFSANSAQIKNLNKNKKFFCNIKKNNLKHYFSYLLSICMRNLNYYFNFHFLSNMQDSCLPFKNLNPKIFNFFARFNFFHDFCLTIPPWVFLGRITCFYFKLYCQDGLNFRLQFGQGLFLHGFLKNFQYMTYFLLF